uniref:VTNC n=1 Tax=Poeciliopsis prolifica TaxID=188132 RepID=A0A0S7LLC9_9TELE
MFPITGAHGLSLPPQSACWQNRDSMKLCLILLLSLSAKAFAEEIFTDSCLDQCENGFQAQRKCQCDSMCKYYKSCCSDYEAICGMTTRGDTFVFAEDDDDDGDLFGSTTPTPKGPADVASTGPPVSDFNQRLHHPPETSLKMTKPPRLVNQRVTPESDLAATTGAPQAPSATTAAPKTTLATTVTTTTVSVTTAAPDPDAVVCSGRPFDSFTQLKNGSIYAFRGALSQLQQHSSNHYSSGLVVIVSFLLPRGVFL